MFNPRPRIERVSVGGVHDVWVVDDVLLDPEALRERAIAGRASFRAAPFNAYPGLEWQQGPDIDGPLSDFFMLHLRQRLGARRTQSMYSRLSLATLQPAQLRPLQRLCHRDRFGTTAEQTVAACTLYLFHDAALGGTSFYLPRRPIEDINADIRRWAAMDDAAFTAEIGAPPGYIGASNAHFELAAVVPAAYNRAVFYDGGHFHSSHITQPEKLSADPAQGRLTLNGFFICRRAAA
ncbi:DUF6445 family protein [Rubrivivax rivuli]|uniref:Uncharacterized protein n=1 Tax=Rubrivivax rivuli TaxID=1862385 RepID=A0A437RSG6_9BURK|nr:DUF6445 family protein [Rubrivivax rivuli]RVU49695.1 hypothetical protein EOE66_03835 [Rubrivivax rivuli]